MKRTIKTVLAVTLAMSATASQALDVRDLLKGIEKAAKDGSAKRGQAPANPNVLPADNYCTRLQNNETIKAYVAVIAKAKANNAMVPNDGYLDTNDRLLSQWVRKKLSSESRDSIELSETMFRYNTVVNECAYQLRNTDFIHVFEPHTPKYMLDSMARYDAQNAKQAEKREVDINGNVTTVASKPQSVPQFISSPRVIEDVTGQWPALYAFAINGGSEVLDKLTSEVPAKVLAAVDANIERDAKQRESMVAEQKRAEDERRASNEAMRKRAAEDATPDGQLLKAYTMFYRVDQCHKARQDYATIYISGSELAESRSTIKKIEAKLKPQVTTTPAQLWTQATRSSRTYTGIDGWGQLPPWDISHYNFTQGRELCQEYRVRLNNLGVSVLGAVTPAKNF